MSPLDGLMSSDSRSATNASCAGAGELSSTVTLAPAAAKVGACWPPRRRRGRGCRRPHRLQETTPSGQASGPEDAVQDLPPPATGGPIGVG